VELRKYLISIRLIIKEEAEYNLGSRMIAVEKQKNPIEFDQPGPYTHLSTKELLISLKNLIKKANSVECLSDRPAREILLEDRK